MGPDFQNPEAGTHHPPAYAANESVPAQVAMGQKVQAQWWQLLGSEPLNGMIAEALAHNRDFAAAKATLEQVQEQASAASGALYPQLGLHGGAEREKLNYTTFGLSYPPKVQNLYSVGAGISYALDVFGHDRRMAEAAGAQAEAESYHLAGAYLSLTGHVVMLSINMAALEAQVQMMGQVVGDGQQILAIRRVGRQSGVWSDRDIAATEADIAADAARLPPMQAKLTEVRHNLAVALGHNPGEWTAPSLDIDGFKRPDAIPVALPSDLLLQRPDIQAAQADLHAATAMVGMAKANRFPRLTLSADVTQWAVRPNELWRNLATGAVGGANFSAPLFQGGQLAAQHHAAQHAFDASLARYEQTVLQAFAQVATQLQNLSSDGQVCDQTTQTDRNLAKTLDYARQELTAGTGSRMVFLQTERQALLARIIRVQAQAQYLQDTSQLLLAMGGGWWDDQKAKIETEDDNNN